MLGDLFIYSFRNLKNRKLRTWLTMIGIVIGITSIVALIGLGNGLKIAVQSQFDFISPDVITVRAKSVISGPPGQGAINPLDIDYLKDIEKLSSVDFAIGILVRTARFEFNDIQTFQFMRSLPSTNEKQKQFKQLNSLEVEFGRDIKVGESGKVILGSNYRNKKKDIFGKNVFVGNKVIINNNEFDVVGILKKKGSIIADNMIIMDEKAMRNLVDDHDTIDSITVKSKSFKTIEKSKEEIYNYLEKERNTDPGDEDFSVETSASALESIGSILDGIQIFVLIIAMISMIVGAIGIVNTMFTAVLERTKEIGIMKAIGAKNSHIFQLFLIESGLLGFIGGILGALLGWGLAMLGTNALSKLIGQPVRPDISIIFIASILIGAFILGAVSGIVPAMKAAKMAPVNALRGTN